MAYTLFLLPVVEPKNCSMMANSVNPDQTIQNVACDLGVHCLLRSVPFSVTTLTLGTLGKW